MVFALEGELPRQQEEENDSEAPEITLLVVGLLTEDFGGYVAWGACYCLGWFVFFD